MHITIQRGRATDIVINITMLRSWHSNKMPNLTVSASLMIGCTVRKFLAAATKKHTLPELHSFITVRETLS
jgi:hypothetical protein